MKQLLYTLRPLMMIVCIAFTALGSVIAQDENEDSDPQPSPTDTGTPGLVVAANSLNVPTVPPPPSADPWWTQGQGMQLQDAIGDSPEAIEARINEAATQVALQLQTAVASRGVVPPILPDTQTAPLTNMQLINALDSFRPPSVPFVGGIGLLPKLSADVMTGTRVTRSIDSTELLRRQSSDVVYSYTYPTNGSTLTVFSDTSFVVEDKNEFTFMTGYFGFIADDTLIMIGERIDGTRYAFYEGYYSAYTVDGDVLIGNRFTEYTYDYDQDGNLLSLTDSDDGEYQVQVEDSGMVSITGPDGYSVLADETGAFELYDEADDLVVAGFLNDASYDEFAQFEASTDDNSGTELDNSDHADPSGEAGGDDDGGAGDSGGDSGDGDDGGGDDGGEQGA